MHVSTFVRMYTTLQCDVTRANNYHRRPHNHCHRHKKHHFQRNLKAKGWMVSFVLSLQAASICWVDRDPITPPTHQHKSYYHKGSFRYQVCGVVTCAREVYSCSPWLGLICVPDEHLCTWYTCLKLVNMCVPDECDFCDLMRFTSKQRPTYRHQQGSCPHWHSAPASL